MPIDIIIQILDEISKRYDEVVGKFNDNANAARNPECPHKDYGRYLRDAQRYGAQADALMSLRGWILDKAEELIKAE